MSPKRKEDDPDGRTRQTRPRAVGAVSVGKRRIQRRLAAILSADIVGYSALMGTAEEDTHRRVGTEISRFRRDIERSYGHVFTVAGDGLIAEFPSAIEAVKCALRFQADSHRRNAAVRAGRRLVFRIGVHSGEIMVQGDRIGGTAVNVAARLEPIADAGGILISAAVYEQVRQSVSLVTYKYLGGRQLKNIREQVDLYAIRPGDCAMASEIPELPRRPSHDPAETKSESRPILAVLPFRMFKKSSTNAYFAEGMIDEIIRALGGFKDLLVISRSSATGFAHFPLDIRRTLHDLDADYILHGSLRQDGAVLRLSVELSSRDRIIWSDRFDGTRDSIFDLQDRIALRVATVAAPYLRSNELARIVRKRPESLTAYDLTLQALSLLDRMERASLVQARSLLEQASACDATYAPAYSHLASLSMRWIAQGWSDDEDADGRIAARVALMAVERDPGDAVGLAICGHLQSYLFQDYDSARNYLDRALASGPSCAWAWAYSGLTFGYIGNTECSIQHAEQSVRLSPFGVDAFWLEHYLSQAYYLAGRFQEAVAWARVSAAKVPNNASNLRCLIASLVASGDQARAKEVARQLLGLMPGYRVGHFRIRTPLRDEARDAFAHRLLEAGLPD